MTHSETTDRSFEKITTHIDRSPETACQKIANEIEELLQRCQSEGRSAVIGLATGSTPVELYRELIRRHREAGLSFSHVTTFNLDEYYGLSPEHPESYRRFMQDQLFDHIDIEPARTHVPSGQVPREQVRQACSEYEQKIRDAGGLDLQILGIGRTGHIGFNEPGSKPDSRTRLVTLDNLTRRDAARDFLGEENVPRHAITMGIGTILEARKVFLLAWGDAKAEVVARSVEGPITATLPASFLQKHPDCSVWIDDTAAGQLTRIRHPWLTGPVDWNFPLTRKAVLWLARKQGKALLKLVDEDYSENGMADLLTQFGSAYQLNIKLFNTSQHTITGWPGGKPNADDQNRPERARPFPKRVLVLAPEPLDDVYCMGGTLHRLANQSNEVTVAYMTSGSLAVPDTDARRQIELLKEVGAGRGKDLDSEFAANLLRQLDEKGIFGTDTDDLRYLKALIRRGEARAACRLLGIDPSRIRFLDLPFYEQGRYRRFSAGEADQRCLVDLLSEVRPHQIFTTGLAHDPLSVSSVAYSVLIKAFQRCREEEWTEDTRIWLFRGPGAEWQAHEIDMAVPLSPDEFENKLQGIYQHQTQRSQAPGIRKGSSSNSWDIAREMNRLTAEYYDALGLAEYEAIECFRRGQLPSIQNSMPKQ